MVFPAGLDGAVDDGSAGARLRGAGTGRRAASSAPRDDQRAADRQPRAVSVPAPSGDGRDADAKRTSVSMTTDVRLAGRRAAPYCSARLPTRKQRRQPERAARPRRRRAPAAPARGRPTSAGAPSAAATSAPPTNIARARPASGRRASRRSITLLKREARSRRSRPASRRARSAAASTRAMRRARRALADGQSTTIAPATPRAMRSQPAGVSRSCSTTPGEHHRPQRHQVEEQHHPDHVADGHGPVEGRRWSRRPRRPAATAPASSAPGGSPAAAPPAITQRRRA